jgi:surface antigen
MLAWAGCAAAQMPPVAAPDESYVPDLAQSYVQELGSPAESTPDAAPQPLLSEAAPAEEPSLQNCQNYDQAVIADGQPRLAHGTACQDDRGAWRVVSTPKLGRERASSASASGNCRELRQPEVLIAGGHRAYVTACRQSDGASRFVASFLAGGPGHRHCRAYEQDILDADRTVVAYGTACEEPDGSWQIVSAPAFGRGVAIDQDDHVRGRAPSDASRETYAQEPSEREAGEEGAPLYREAPYPPRSYHVSPLQYAPEPRFEDAQRSSPSVLVEGPRRLSNALDRVVAALVRPFRPSDRRQTFRTRRAWSERSEEYGRTDRTGREY